MNVKLRDFLDLTEFISHDSAAVDIEQLTATVNSHKVWVFTDELK